MYKKTLLTAISTLVLACSSFAETYYLGDNKDPDDDLSSLRGDLMPGDELIIRDGTYSDLAFKFYGLGTEENPITLRAETPGGVVLNGKSYVQLDGVYLIVRDLVFYNGDDYLRQVNSRVFEFRGSYYGHAHHCRVTNCAIIDMNYQFIDTKDEDDDGDTTDLIWENGRKWIQIYGTNNRVDHCHFSDKKTQDVLLVTEIGSDYNWRGEDPTREDETPQYESIKHRIDNNYFANISSDGYYGGSSPNGYEAIRTGTSTYSNFNAEIVVENNLFENCNGEIEVISNKSSNNIYRNNTLLNNKGGIVMRHGDACVVENNIILGGGLDDSTGIRLNGQDHIVVGNYISGVTGTGMRAAITMRDAGDVTGEDTGGGYEQSRFNTIAFNTVVNCTEPLNLDSSGSSDNSYPPVDNTIVNNVIYCPDAVSAVVSDNSTSEFNNAVSTWDANFFYAQSLGKTSISGVEFIDPMLVSRSDALYTLSRPDSPAAGSAAEGYDELATDIDGDLVPSSNADAGADQLGTDQLSAPMSSDDVGPDFSLDTWLNK